MRIACVIGTRPEAIKLGPVVHALRQAGSAFSAVVVNAGQHQREVVTVLGELDLHADETLDDCRGQSLGAMTSSLIANLSRSNELARADMVLVQGDTTTAFAGGLAAFHRSIPVAHLEAGVRSGIPDAPFPEEAHRKMLAMLASVHLAPTEHARRNLRAIGVLANQIAVVGNTCVDALNTYGACSREAARSALALDGRRVVLVTLHRRESWNGALRQICDGIAAAAQQPSQALVVFPVHGNPRVREVVMGRMSHVPYVRLLDPLPYRKFAAYLHAADVVVTDSGGVQEEAATLGIRTLVVRSVTDRPEAVDAGVAQLVGTDALDVSRALRSALQSSPESCAAVDIYGDGRAAHRVVEVMKRWRQGLRPLLPHDLEFCPASVPRDNLAAG
jgi:UDP-N-acetylglucosamine 2-epimerase (non-hydrolysing)